MTKEKFKKLDWYVRMILMFLTEVIGLVTSYVAITK